MDWIGKAFVRRSAGRKHNDNSVKSKRLLIERLEDRTLLSVSAGADPLPRPFKPFSPPNNLEPPAQEAGQGGQRISAERRRRRLLLELQREDLVDALHRTIRDRHGWRQGHENDAGGADGRDRRTVRPSRSIHTFPATRRYWCAKTAARSWAPTISRLGPNLHGRHPSLSPQTREAPSTSPMKSECVSIRASRQ